MSRPALHSILRTLVAVTACVGALAVVQRVQDNDSSAATPGLRATFSGKAFAAGPGSSQPVMRMRGLRQGQAISGTVTVSNPGPGTRYFWLSPGRVTERARRLRRPTEQRGGGDGDGRDRHLVPVGDLPRAAPVRGRAAAGVPRARCAPQLQLRGRTTGRRAIAGGALGRPLSRRGRHHRLDLAFARRQAGHAGPGSRAGGAQARPVAPRRSRSRCPAASSCWNAGG